MDFALYGIDVEDAENELDTAVRGSNYVANLIAVRAVQPYYLIVCDLLKVSRHLRSTFAGLVGVIWRVGHGGAESRTTRTRFFGTWVGAWTG